MADPTGRAADRRVEREAWILDYLGDEAEESAVHAPFHAAYASRFGGPVRPAAWGARVSPRAMADLRRMHAAGRLARGRIGLGASWQPGWPSWVYAYSRARPQES